MYTLENTNNFASFWKKRIIRLFPSMLIASVITYLVFCIFDSDNLFITSHFFKNVLASITFMPPDSLASLFNNAVQLDYVSGSYWSLWPEIQFYLLVSIIFFLSKKRFQIIFFIISFLLIVINFLLHQIYIDFVFLREIKHLFRVFNLMESLPYFCYGIIFYVFFKNKSFDKETPVYIKIYFLVLSLFVIYSNWVDMFKLGVVFSFLLLFMILIYYPKRILFLENKFFLTIGISSYFLYLIHENIGVLLINKFGHIMKTYEFLIPIGVIIFLTIMSIFYTIIIDKKINYHLKKYLLKSN